MLRQESGAGVGMGHSNQRRWDAGNWTPRQWVPGVSLKRHVCVGMCL